MAKSLVKDNKLALRHYSLNVYSIILAFTLIFLLLSPLALPLCEASIQRGYVEIKRVEIIPEGWRVSLRVSNPYSARISYDTRVIDSKGCSVEGLVCGALEARRSQEISVLLRPRDPGTISCYAKIEFRAYVNGRPQPLGVAEILVTDDPSILEQLKKGAIYGFNACKDRYAGWGCYLGATITRTVGPMTICGLSLKIQVLAPACTAYLSMIAGEECYYAIAEGSIEKQISGVLVLIAVAALPALTNLLRIAPAVAGFKGAYEIAKAIRLAVDKGADKRLVIDFISKLLKEEFYSQAAKKVFKFTPDRILHMIERSRHPLGHFDDIMKVFKLKNYDELIKFMKEAIKFGKYLERDKMTGYVIYQFIKDGKRLKVVLDDVRNVIVTMYPWSP